MEYYDEYDDIDDLLFELAVKRKALDKGSLCVYKLDPWEIEEHIDEIVKRIDITIAITVLGDGLRYLAFMESDPLNKYIALKCHAAFLRLKAFIKDCKEVYEFCDELLKVIRSGLVKLKEEEFKKLSRRAMEWRGILIV